MKVFIYKPAKSAMQSGHGKSNQWVLEYEPTSKRAPEDLMGWTSSSDTLNQVKLKFDTQAEAIEFAKKKGWQYMLPPAHKRKSRPRSYMDNFKYVPPNTAAKTEKKTKTSSKTEA